jgi:hypothetical protein
MKLNIKSFLYIGAGLFGLFAYWYATNSHSNPDENNTSSIITLDVENAQTTGATSETKVLTKKEAYQEAAEQKKQAEYARLEQIRNSDDQALSSMNIMPNPEDQREKSKEEGNRVKPQYAGYTELAQEENSKKDEIVKVNYFKEAEKKDEPKIYAASIKTTRSESPKKSKSEVKKDESDSDSEESYFNNTLSGKKSENFSSSTSVADKSSMTMIKCKVDGNQEAKAGGQIRFRTIQAFSYNGVNFPRNTIFNGKVGFSDERMHVTVDKIPYKSGYIPIAMELHDLDMEKGIYAPVSKLNEEGIDQASQGLTQVLQTAGSTTPLGAGSGLIGNAAGGLLRSATRKDDKVPVGDSAEIYFKIVADEK